jgi:hypothetical protein
MADFKTHLTASTVLGIGYGGAACAVYHAPLSSSILAAGLCGVSGMLPDIDSGPGRPLREITSFMAAVVPTMAFGHLQVFGLSQESIILTGAAIYVAIRFGLASFMKHYTVHRGMFHSLPAAAIFGEIAYLMASGDDTLRLYKAGAVVLGFVSHLFLDEVYSFEWSHGSVHLKSSFGTALKIFGHGLWPNISTYAKLAILSAAILYQPYLTQKFSERMAQHQSERTALRNAISPNGPANTSQKKIWPWQ